MPKRKTNKRGVVLFVVLAIILVVAILSSVVLKAVTNQSRLTHHQVSRIQAYYAGKGVMNYALDMLRKGTWALPPSGVRYACHRNCAGMGVPSPTYAIPTDSDIPYSILATLYSNGRIDIKTDYTYSP
jgi:Tfp pilus assembly protein PilX